VVGCGGISRNQVGHEARVARLTGIAEAIGAKEEVRVVEGVTPPGVGIDGVEMERAHKIAALLRGAKSKGRSAEGAAHRR
jgi:hypothetical protein